MLDPDLIHLAYTLLAVIGFLLALYLNWRVEFGKRSSARSQFADKNGFNIIALPPKDIGHAVVQGAMIAVGWGRGDFYENFMGGERSGYFIRIVDYGLSTGRVSEVQTIICIPIMGLGLPEFSLLHNDTAKKIARNKKISTEADRYGLLPDYKLLTNVPFVDMGFFSDGFIANSRRIDKLDVEYVQGKLMVYCFRKRISSMQLSLVINIAIALADDLKKMNLRT